MDNMEGIMEPLLTREAIASPLLAQLPKGIFLSVGGAAPNVMTVGWGGLSFYWGKDIFVAPIRPQRFTHAPLLQQKAFTLSVPAPESFAKELHLCGTLSGRDGDKFQAAGITPAAARAVDAPIVPGCAFYLECRVLATHAFTKEGTDPAIRQMTYTAGDFHTLFYGEIVASYWGA